MARSLAVIVAHPDDESYSTYGTVARYADDPEFRLVVLHATDGEGGEIADGVPATRETLGAWRRQEDESAWRALGKVPDRHDWLGLPDGGLDRIGVAALRETIVTFLREERPDVVATLGTDGVTGHPDHIIVSHATIEAFHIVRQEPGPGMQRLLLNGIPLSFFRRGQLRLRELGLPAWDPTKMYHLRGIPDEQFGIISDSRPVITQVLAAIKEHRSQRQVIFEPNATDEEWMKILARESWIIAWPPREPGRRRLQDMFEGLA